MVGRQRLKEKKSTMKVNPTRLCSGWHRCLQVALKTSGKDSMQSH